MDGNRSGVGAGNACFGKAGFGAGTTTTITTANAIVFANKHVLYSKAAAANAASPTVDSATGGAFKPVPPGSMCVFALGFSAAGTLMAAQGQVVLAGDDYGSRYPIVPDTMTVCGAVKVVVAAAGAAWTFGTSNNSGANLAFTWQDLMGLPAYPAV